MWSCFADLRFQEVPETSSRDVLPPKDSKLTTWKDWNVQLDVVSGIFAVHLGPVVCHHSWFWNIETVSRIDRHVERHLKKHNLAGFFTWKVLIWPLYNFLTCIVWYREEPSSYLEPLVVRLARPSRFYGADCLANQLMARWPDGWSFYVKGRTWQDKHIQNWIQKSLHSVKTPSTRYHWWEFFVLSV